MADAASPEDRLIAIVEAYGAEPSLWPAEVRREGDLALMAAPSPRLAAAITAADRLDTLLDDLGPPPLPAGLERAILDAAPAPSWWQSLLAPVPRRLSWLPASGALASLAIGLAIGLGTASSGAGLAEPAPEDEILYAALGYGGVLDTIEEATP